MHVWSSIGGAVCIAVTVVGLVLSWRVWRKKGATRGMRAVAWSLLPLAAYLTHTIMLLGRVVNAFVLFAGSFVFSPKAWAGVVVAALAAALFLVSGGLPLLNWRKARERRKAAAGDDRTQHAMAAVGTSASNGSASSGSASSGSAGNGTAGNGKASKAPVPRDSADDDLGDVEEILRKRGIK